MVEAEWSPRELLACSLLVGEQTSATDGSPRFEAAHCRMVDARKCGAAGPGMLGFGAQCECGMHIAAACNRVWALRILKQHTSSREQRDVRGRAPLHSAAATGALEAARELLDQKCDPLDVDRHGHTALAVAASAGHTAVCQLLVDVSPQAMHMGPRLPLELAAGAGAIDTAKTLLAVSAQIDQQTASGKTALHAATRSGKVDMCKFLVDAGASIAIKDRSGRVAHEVVPDALAADFKWLTDLGRQKARMSRAERKSSLEHVDVS